MKGIGLTIEDLENSHSFIIQCCNSNIFRNPEDLENNENALPLTDNKTKEMAINLLDSYLIYLHDHSEQENFPQNDNRSRNLQYEGMFKSQFMKSDKKSRNFGDDISSISNLASNNPYKTVMQKLSATKAHPQYQIPNKG